MLSAVNVIGGNSRQGQELMIQPRVSVPVVYNTLQKQETFAPVLEDSRGRIFHKRFEQCISVTVM